MATAETAVLDHALPQAFLELEAVRPEAMPLAERVLLGVDYLLDRRLADGTYTDGTLAAIHTNLLTATKEMAIPHAISTIYMDKVAEGTYLFNDQTSIEVAQSGYRYHHHPAALQRVAVEVAEAEHNAYSLEPDKLRIFISPRMTEADAPVGVAKQEHLAHDDALRVTRIGSDGSVAPGSMAMDAILIKDVPLDAWVAMLRDPANMFGKPIWVANEASALSVMQAFRDMEVPAAALPDGIKGVVRSVIPYITDPIIRSKVKDQYHKLHADQQEIHERASGIADRWLAFEVEMAESLYHGEATPYIRDFVQEFHDLWGDTTKGLLYTHALANGGLQMSRELAVKIEEVRVKTLWLKSAIVNGNEEVISQVDDDVVADVIQNEQYIQSMIRDGYHIHEILAADNRNNSAVAEQDVQGGGGCPGDINADIKGREQAKSDGAEGSKDGSTEEKASKEEVLKCVKCPLCNKEGVDARIQYYVKKKRITCSSCRQYKEYKNG